jgi:hypothetical protein
MSNHSFVVESNVHFPTDYGLLWDCCRKSLDTVGYFLRKYPWMEGWRKIKHLPVHTDADLVRLHSLEFYMQMLAKHIDLLDRRVMKGEKIAHSEKMMSIFETYSEWVAKGKFRPSVEIGKKLSITTDQFNLIVLHKLMDNEQDRDIVVEIADNMLSKYKLINLSRCPDRSYLRFCTYVAMGVCAYNLKKIGKKILEDKLKELLLQRAA